MNVVRSLYDTLLDNPWSGSQHGTHHYRVTGEWSPGVQRSPIMSALSMTMGAWRGLPTPPHVSPGANNNSSPPLSIAENDDSVNCNSWYNLWWVTWHVTCSHSFPPGPVTTLHHQSGVAGLQTDHQLQPRLLYSWVWSAGTNLWLTIKRTNDANKNKHK